MSEVSTGQSYLKLAQQKYEVHMPSGAVFLIKPPNAFWFVANLQSLPSAAIAAAREGQTVLPQTAEEVSANLDLNARLIEEHVLRPSVRRNPDRSRDEIGFEDLLPEDARFLLDYLFARGDKDGNSVSTFPTEQQRVVVPSTSS